MTTPQITIANAPELFVVQQGGRWAGLLVQPGDVLVIDPTAPARDGELVVLTPRGVGRPMTGTRVGGQLRGPWGEPCSSERWRVAGKLVEVQRQRCVTEQLPLFRQAA